MTLSNLDFTFLLTFTCVLFLVKWTTATESQLIRNSEKENDFYRKQLPRRSVNSVKSATYNNANLDQWASEVATDKNSPSWFSGTSVECDEICEQNTNNGYVNEIGSVDNDSFMGDIGKRPSSPMGFTSQLGKRDSVKYGYRKNLEKRAHAGFLGHLGRTPIGFMNQLGRRSPIGFISQLGKRAPMGFVSQLVKRAPMGFISQLGKRAPMGFISQLGKRAPMGFLSQLGKRAPIGYISQLGKRAPMGFISQLGKRAPMGYISQLGKRFPLEVDSQLEKRAHTGFISQLGRRAPLGLYSQLGKRAPMGFISQLGKRSDSSVFMVDNTQEHDITLRRKRASALPWIFSRRQVTSSGSSIDSSFDKRPNTNFSFFPQLGKREVIDDFIYPDY